LNAPRIYRAADTGAGVNKALASKTTQYGALPVSHAFYHCSRDDRQARGASWPLN